MSSVTGLAGTTTMGANLELLVLLLQQVVTTSVEAHHISSHNVGEHVREAERRHFLVVASGRSTELLQTLQLRLSLSKVTHPIVRPNRASATI